MSDEDFQSLKDSIENIGVQNPISIFQGMIIDGWHRYRAANELRMNCPKTELIDVDPQEFVLAQNKTRRHITQAQMAMATATVYAWVPLGKNQYKEDGQYSEKRVDTGCPPSKTTAELSRLAGVHPSTIKQAKTVQRTASPEVIEAVRNGDIGLRKAASIAKLPQVEQAAAIHQPMPKQEMYQDEDDPVSILVEENDRLTARLAVAAMEATPEEKQLATETIESLQSQIKILTIELDAVKASRDNYMREANELKKQCAGYKRQLDKIKKG